MPSVGVGIGVGVGVGVGQTMISTVCSRKPNALRSPAQGLVSSRITLGCGIRFSPSLALGSSVPVGQGDFLTWPEEGRQALKLLKLLTYHQLTLDP